MSTISQLATLARGLALAQKLGAEKKRGTHAIDSNPSSPTSANQAATSTISNSNNQFSAEVEKHLSDYRSGQAALSKQTAGKIQRADDANAQLLQEVDPKLLSNYGNYGSFMSYEKRARYVTNIYSSAQQIAKLKKAFEAA